MDELLEFLKRLREANIFYRIGSVRDEAVTVELAVPGERWEVEFFGDESVEVEVFRSDGKILGREKLTELFDRFSD